MPETLPYPVVFEPILLDKPWGGTRLAALGKHLGARTAVGESWELADLDATAASGAGGSPQRSLVANGPLKGRTVRDLIRTWGRDILPDGISTYPLLIKFLDARENLSVQVHPSAAYAAKHPACHLKDECWLVLDAVPGSVIYKGVNPGVTHQTLRAALTPGTRIENLLQHHPARTGDVHALPSGTLHALGAGVLVAEVQTPSDTTFRLYDWNRAGRALHIEEALECTVLTPPPPVMPFDASTAHGGVFRTPYFTLTQYRVDLLEGRRLPAAAHGAAAYMVLAGRGEFVDCRERVEVRTGITGLIPGGLPDNAALHATGPDPLVVLVVDPRPRSAQRLA